MKEKMNKQKYNFFRNNFIRFIIIPLFLLSFWFGLTTLYIIRLDTAFSLLSYNLPKSVFTNLLSGKLEKGNYISGEFTAQENNLGIVSVRFQTFFRPAYKNEDVLLFQIKQKGAGNWYYENKYRNGLIYDVPFFPFGFPIIPDSKGKTYEFKIASLRGDKNNSVAISQRRQNIAAKYKYSKQYLLEDKAKLLTFSAKKFINSFQTIDVLFSSFVYLLPLFFYLMLMPPLGTPLKKNLEKPKHFIRQRILDFGENAFLKLLMPSFKTSERLIIVFFDGVLLGVVLIDGLYLQLGNDFIYLLVPILWIIIQKHFRFASRKTFIVGISLLLFPPVFLQFKLGQIAENMAVWAYLFLVAGIVQLLIEYKKENPIN